MSTSNGAALVLKMHKCFSFGEEHRFWPTDDPAGDRNGGKKDPDYYNYKDDYLYENEVNNEFWDPFGNGQDSEVTSNEIQLLYIDRFLLTPG